MIARRVSGRPTMVEELKTRKWVVRPSSRPPPRATEEIEEIVGIGSAEMSRNVPRSLARNSPTLYQAVSFAMASRSPRSENRRTQLCSSQHAPSSPRPHKTPNPSYWQESVPSLGPCPLLPISTALASSNCPAGFSRARSGHWVCSVVERGYFPSQGLGFAGF